ncbi:MAG TPA: hypothetical protein VHE30_08490 [Polyangiaceae bacterium]|nr:hypothetical protein [Polyangiaceae bacterium]
MPDQEEPSPPDTDALERDLDGDADQRDHTLEEEELPAIALEPEGDLDDATATELDPGIDIPDLDEAADEDDPSLEAYSEIDETTHEDDGDAEDDSGPVGDDASVDIEEQEPLGEDDGEGATEELESLVSGELPILGADPDGEREIGDHEPLLRLPEEEEGIPPRAEFGWQEVAPPPLLSPRNTVHALHGTRVACGGANIVVLDDAGAERTIDARVPGTVTSFCETADGTLVFTTSAGRLARFVPERAEVSALSPLAEDLAQDRTLTLGGPTPSARPAVLLLVEPDGLLLESTDQGTTWRRVDLGGKVLALSRGTPPVCLVAQGSRTKWFHSEPTGGFTPSPAPYPTDGESPVVVTEGDVVVVLERGRGVSVSATRAASFERVKASSRVTAIAAGRLGSRPSAFAATFEPASGRTLILWIDATSGDAFVVASLEPNGDDDADDQLRVDALAWEPQTETLWASGAFGVRRFRRPPSA